MEASEHLATVRAMHAEARRRGLFFQNATDEELDGRYLTLNGQRLLAFTSCSYLGLEYHPALIEGVQQYAARYGTQFSSSRGYVSAPPYKQLEENLSTLFGGHVLVTSSTTMGHQIALPVMVTEKDAIVLDSQVHYSVQMAATLCRANGTVVERVHHRDLHKAHDVILRLSKHHRTVWITCDGVYSMYGDLAPLATLQELLNVAPNVRLYVDDAHGMSWAGRHGRGSFLSRYPMNPRTIVATSLNKAFAASGAAIIFPTEEERETVRMCGGPIVFSGPLQVPMLGAALASAKIHMSDEIIGRQSMLRERVDLVNKLLRQHCLPLLVENESPIFFVRLGLPRAAFKVAERLAAEGIYVNVSMYPSVPMKRAGIRLSVTATHSLEDISRAISAMARHVPEVLIEEGMSPRELDDLFANAVPPESWISEAYRQPEQRLEHIHIVLEGNPSAPPRAPSLAPRSNSFAPSIPPPPVAEDKRTGREARPGELRLVVAESIHDVDREVWDKCLGTVGACSWDAMEMAERAFVDHPLPEHNWKFWYMLVFGADDRPVCATFFTKMLNKDDMLMREEVSRAVELRRLRDPYFLTSKMLTMGSGLSEGNHLYLDRSGPWQAALDLVMRKVADVYERESIALMALRDLPMEDPELEAELLGHGYVKMPMFDSHHLHVTWGAMANYPEFVGTSSLKRSQKKRGHLRDRIEESKNFTRHVYSGADGPKLDDWRLKTLYAMYKAVATRKLRLNVFLLPENLFREMLSSPAWEIVTLHLDLSAGGPEDGGPVAWYAAHVKDGHYAPFVCGLDYGYVYIHGAYRQLLYQIVLRAHELGSHEVHMGMDADIEKSRFGTVLQKNAVYVQARDHFHGQVMHDIVQQVGLDNAPWETPIVQALSRPRDKWFTGARR